MAESSLHIYAARGEPDGVKFLLGGTSGCDVSVVDHEGKTALALAAEHQHCEVMKLLIDAGCDVNVVDHHGNSALSESVQENNLKSMQILLAANADTNIRDSRGRTPLHLAALTTNVVMAELLVTAGCNLDIQDDDGFTALFLASWLGTNNSDNSLRLLEALTDAGADVDIPDNTGRPPVAAAWSRWRHLACLVRSGCRVSDVTINGYALLAVAAFECDASKMELLLLAGARAGVGHLRPEVVRRHRKQMELLQELLMRPLGLKEQSRIVVRRHIEKPLVVNACRLVLPQCMLDYIRMREWS